MVWLVFFPLKIRKVGHIGDIGHVVYAHCSFLLLKLVGHTDQVGHADHIFTQILFFPSANCFHLSLFCPIRSLIWKDYSKFPQKSTFRGHVLIWISNWCLRCYLPRVDLFGNRAILIIDIKIPFDCKLGRASKFDFFLEKMKKRQRSHRQGGTKRWSAEATLHENLSCGRKSWPPTYAVLSRNQLCRELRALIVWFSWPPTYAVLSRNCLCRKLRT